MRSREDVGLLQGVHRLLEPVLPSCLLRALVLPSHSRLGLLLAVALVEGQDVFDTH